LISPPFFLRWRACCAPALLVFKRFGDDFVDRIAFTTTSAAELITAQRRGEPMAQRIERYNRDLP